jgi:hypothetical protein
MDQQRHNKRESPTMSLTLSSSRHLSLNPLAVTFPLLFSACRRIFSGERDDLRVDLPGSTTYHSIDSLQQSAKDGCQICKMLCSSLQQENNEDVWEQLYRENC